MRTFLALLLSLLVFSCGQAPLDPCLQQKADTIHKYGYASNGWGSNSWIYEPVPNTVAVISAAQFTIAADGTCSVTVTPVTP